LKRANDTRNRKGLEASFLVRWIIRLFAVLSLSLSFSSFSLTRIIPRTSPTCIRSYGKDVRGLMRQHQFFKVEMVKVTAPEDSQAEHEALTQDAEDLLQVRRAG